MTVASGSGWELRLGRWQDVLQDVECDALITDPPYSERTHSGQRHGRRDPRYAPNRASGLCSTRGIGYEAMSPECVKSFVDRFAPACRGWFCVMTSHDLAPEWADALSCHGRYVFAPIACVQPGMNVRLAGDGPSNWTVWMIVSRPRSMRAWGTLPGAYVAQPGNGPTRATESIPGGKPPGLMRAIIRDYTRPGDLVCDPCAGAATTLLAAVSEGRRAIGSEMDQDTYAKAVKRLQRGHTPPLFTDGL